MAAQQQQQYNRGILPSETLNALDYLVDRLNASSGRLPAITATSKDGASASATTTTDGSSSSSSSNNNAAASAPLPIRALLVGTNEGVGLSRSLGTAHTASQMASASSVTTAATTAAADNFSFSGNMSEEVLSSIETVWATLVSAVSPHVMAASASAASSMANSDGNVPPPHMQPSHPLLSPLHLGDTIKTVTATYDNCTLMHVHMAPLVVTFVTLPEANIGAVKSMALPILKVLLEPVRRALVRSRGGNGGANDVSGGGGQMGMSQQQMHQMQMQQQQPQQGGGQQNDYSAMQNQRPNSNNLMGLDAAMQHQQMQMQQQFQMLNPAQQQQVLMMQQQQFAQQQGGGGGYGEMMQGYSGSQ
jgi:hypothetical protein